ncbi:NADH-quinone oxidoreductase subunit C [Candidatus Odyssella acanthamoebae]|uniref:NADH-quinone oxidoreductase subunit C n=1 Tax=Candidatus Odyssella acanthamoebae TaxID=91604 RepID=A0A077AS23_9PROT|nr:NADH-quinone oxidoreductase subunit C [Candidatus Paracaedibacter acanthamoebae]AIK95967.1 NADH dehydrogenase [Candidatus Paracaedibacter acanthamoebae]
MEKLDHLTTVVQEALGPDLITAKLDKDELTIETYAGSIVRVLTILRDHPQCLFRLLLDVCGVDYPDDHKRFRVVYHLLSIQLNLRIRVKVALVDGMEIPSVTGVFNAANWYERETYDLYGIRFSDHPDLRRLLTDYEFDGHPLRKDFPLTGYVEVTYDDEKKKVVYNPVSLPQDFRNFDYLSPWEGMLHKNNPLPGDEKAKA